MITSHTSLIRVPNCHFTNLSIQSPSCPAGEALIPPRLSLTGGVCVLFASPSSNKGAVVASATDIAWVAVQVERLTHTF